MKKNVTFILLVFSCLTYAANKSSSPLVGSFTSVEIKKGWDKNNQAMKKKYYKKHVRISGLATGYHALPGTDKVRITLNDNVYIVGEFNKAIRERIRNSTRKPKSKRFGGKTKVPKKIRVSLTAVWTSYDLNYLTFVATSDLKVQ